LKDHVSVGVAVIFAKFLSSILLKPGAMNTFSHALACMDGCNTCWNKIKYC
jgi:hypothetical protein